MPNPETIRNKVAKLVPVGSPESVRWSQDAWKGKDRRGSFLVVRFARSLIPEQTPGTQTVYVMVEGNTIENGRTLARDFTRGLETVVFQHELEKHTMQFFEYPNPSSEAV